MVWMYFMVFWMLLWRSIFFMKSTLPLVTWASVEPPQCLQDLQQIDSNTGFWNFAAVCAKTRQKKLAKPMG